MGDERNGPFPWTLAVSNGASYTSKISAHKWSIFSEPNGGKP